MCVCVCVCVWCVCVVCVWCVVCVFVCVWCVCGVCVVYACAVCVCVKMQFYLMLQDVNNNVPLNGSTNENYFPYCTQFTVFGNFQY
jgi:hypothetical protein